MIEIYTDGSSRGNPGQGGYGVAALKNNKIDLIASKQFENVTNNQMELKALIQAMEWCYSNYALEDVVIIYSDSAYCVNMVNSWIWTWCNNGWKNSKKQTVENYELVRKIYDLLQPQFPLTKNFEIKKVSGHNGIVGNEIADALATQNQTKFKKIISEKGIEVLSELNFDF